MAVCLAALPLAMPTPVQAQDKTAVKAALVYNIMRFVSFPGDPSIVRVCALTSDPVAPDLRRLQGRSVGNARVHVELVGSTPSLGASCDVIYLDNASPSAVGGAGRGQVIIGGARGFAENGGTVGLIKFGGQIRFVINSDAARRSGVSFSSQLMQLAAKVVS